MSPIVKVGNLAVDADQLRMDWALTLMMQGIIVRLSISRWQGTARLKPEDLGLKIHSKDSEKFLHSYLTLGRQRLFPPDILASISASERTARRNLEEHSFNTVWGAFVPYTAFEEWYSENERCKEEFMAIAEDIGLRYDSIVLSVMAQYREWAKDVWKRMYPEDGGEPPPSFTQDFASRMASKIPLAQDIVASFSYDTTYSIIPMPAFVESNVSKAKKIARDAQMEEFNSRLERKTREKIANDYSQRKQELLDGFLDATVKTMRAYIAEICGSVVKSFDGDSDKTDLTKRQRDRITKMIKKVSSLNFYKDDGIAELMSDVRKEMVKFKGERNDGIIIAKLNRIYELAEADLKVEEFHPVVDYLADET